MPISPPARPIRLKAKEAGRIRLELGMGRSNGLARTSGLAHRCADLGEEGLELECEFVNARGIHRAFFGVVHGPGARLVFLEQRTVRVLELLRGLELRQFTNDCVEPSPPSDRLLVTGHPRQEAMHKRNVCRHECPVCIAEKCVVDIPEVLVQVDEII